MPVRKLVLRAERLADLTGDDLRKVAGGSHLCATDQVTHGPTCEAACLPTDPLNACLSLDARLCTLTCNIQTI